MSEPLSRLAPTWRCLFGDRVIHPLPCVFPRTPSGGPRGEGRVTIPVPHWTYFWAMLRFAFWDGPRQLYRCVRRHPKLWTIVLAFVGLSVLVGPNDATYALYLPVLAVPWRIVHRASYNRWLSGPLRSDWRRWSRYQRHWPDSTSLNRLSVVIDNGLDVHPEIVKVRCEGHSRRWRTQTCTDHVWVRTLISQDVEDYQDRAPTIARDYGARACRVFAADKGRVRLEFAYGPDPLAETIPALSIPATADEIDFSAVPVGRTEKGEPWTIDLSLHVLLAGATGSGKSGVLQQLIRSLAPAIRDGLVVVHAIDAKDGVELWRWEPLCRGGYEDDDPEAMVALLEAAVVQMKRQSRAAKAGGNRSFRATPETPLHLIVIDEMMDLTDPKSERKDVVKRVHPALGLLLRKGRSAGFIVIGSVTDPREAALPMKNGFPTRIGMRLKAPQETTTILGPGARLNGARCDQIGKHEPGVGFTEDAERVRAAYVTDADIAAMARDYAPGSVERDPERPAWDFESTADEDIDVPVLDGPVLELVQGDWTEE